MQWYYRKKDINKEKNGLTNIKKFNALSDFEVFKSEHKDVIFIESILSKCDVYNFDEYDALENHTATTFFCRASYDPSKKQLNPPFDKWQKSCKCMLPLNPDQLYIKCEKCDKWFHPSCSNVKEEEVESIYFVCFKCDKDKH